MFTWDWVCKHTVFFTLMASQAAQGTGSTGNRQHREQAAQEDRQHREQAAQEDRQHRKTGSTGRQAAQEDRQHREQAAQEDRQHPQTFCTICSQWHAASPPEHIAQFVHSGMQHTASGRLVSRRVTRGQIAQSVHSVQGDRAISWP